MKFKVVFYCFPLFLGVLFFSCQPRVGQIEASQFRSRFVEKEIELTFQICDNSQRSNLVVEFRSFGIFSYVSTFFSQETILNRDYQFQLSGRSLNCWGGGWDNSGKIIYFDKEFGIDTTAIFPHYQSKFERIDDENFRLFFFGNALEGNDDRDSLNLMLEFSTKFGFTHYEKGSDCWDLVKIDGVRLKKSPPIL